ncbi:unnamed protein product [Schistocephalus solidus]|uniref:Reverse transcriptase domain-containing protein n=1 Tax=Schistocephalus solidus TaxID=70667 RepID=A0A183TKA9_SCHSO|nr:unnamed protein product [Schistocephalus solidus]
MVPQPNKPLFFSALTVLPECFKLGTTLTSICCWLSLSLCLQEIIRAVQQISSEKAPGSGAIPDEFYKQVSPQLMNPVTALFLSEITRLDDGAHHVNGAASKAFIVNNGVKHGCMLAPNLFSLMFSILLLDVYRDERTCTDSQLLNRRRMQVLQRLKTTSPRLALQGRRRTQHLAMQQQSDINQHPLCHHCRKSPTKTTPTIGAYPADDPPPSILAARSASLMTTSTTCLTRTTAETTRHLLLPPPLPAIGTRLLPVTAHAHYSPAYSVTCESIAQASELVPGAPTYTRYDCLHGPSTFINRMGPHASP